MKSSGRYLSWMHVKLFNSFKQVMSQICCRFCRQLRRNIRDCLQEENTIPSPSNRIGFYTLFLCMCISLGKCNFNLPLTPCLSKSCQWWWRNSQSTAFERYADTSDRRNQAGAVHFAIGIDCLNQRDSDVLIIFWSAKIILCLNRFFLPKLAQIFFTQGVTSSLQIPLKRPNTPSGNKNSISLSELLALRLVSLKTDPFWKNPIEAAPDIQSSTNSRNKFSHSSWILDSSSVIKS